MFKQTFPLAILAGLCISIGCIVNLRVGGVAGAVLFAFGLTTALCPSSFGPLMISSATACSMVILLE